MQRHDKILVAATTGLLVYTLLLSFLGPTVASLVASAKVGNTGSVKAIGVGVYSDSLCTSPVTSFTWGMLNPNSTSTKTCYIKNSGNSNVTLSMSTSNWIPSNASSYITFNWNLQNQILTSGQVKQATFTLTVSSSVTGITNFSFDITIVGTG
jgi:hypothetical protein